MSDWFGRNRARYGPEWDAIATEVKEQAGWCCEACGVPHGPAPDVLTVDHLDGVPEHMERENLMALCQRCHLARQGLTKSGRLRVGASQFETATALARWRYTAPAPKSTRWPTPDAEGRHFMAIEAHRERRRGGFQPPLLEVGGIVFKRNVLGVYRRVG